MKVANRSSHVIVRLFPEDKKNNLVIHNVQNMFFQVSHYKCSPVGISTVVIAPA